MEYKYNEDFFDKIDKLSQWKKQQNPVSVEYEKIFNDIFPIEKVVRMYKFGQVTILSDILNRWNEYLSVETIEFFESVVEVLKSQDEDYKYFAEKLIK